MFKDTCLGAIATKYTRSEDEYVFMNTGVYLFRDEALKFMESHFASTIEPRAKRWKQPWGIDWGNEPMIGRLTGARHPMMDNMVSAESKASQILNYIAGLQRALQSMRSEDDERMALSLELSKYGVHIHDSPHIPIPTIESLKKTLEDSKKADEEIEAYRTDEWLMNELARQNSPFVRQTRDGSCRVDKLSTPTGTVEKQYTISATAMRRLQPDIEEKRWNNRVDAEAKARIEQEIRRKEAERFEAAVQLRLRELKNM
jgi:hypothetical protein